MSNKRNLKTRKKDIKSTLDDDTPSPSKIRRTSSSCLDQEMGKENMPPAQSSDQQQSQQQTSGSSASGLSSSNICTQSNTQILLQDSIDPAKTLTKRKTFVPPPKTRQQKTDLLNSDFSFDSSSETSESNEKDCVERSRLPQQKLKGRFVSPLLSQPGGVSSTMRSTDREGGSSGKSTSLDSRQENQQFVSPAESNNIPSISGKKTAALHNPDVVSLAASKSSTSAEGGSNGRPTRASQRQANKQVVSTAESTHIPSIAGGSTSALRKPGGVNAIPSIAGCSTSSPQEPANTVGFFRPTYFIDSSDDDSDGSYRLPESSSEDSSSDSESEIDDEDSNENSDERDNEGEGDNEERDNEDEEEETESGGEENLGRLRSRVLNQDNSKPSRTKRRIRQTTSASRQERKEARNSGEAYRTETGKLVPAKSPTPLKDCKMKCASRILPEVPTQLCNGLWQGLADQNRRPSFIGSLIDIKPKASLRLDSTTSPSKKKNRNYTHQYHLSIRGERIQVCKICFISVFDISGKFIETAVKKKLSNIGGVITNDGLGQTSHSSLSERQRLDVRAHLNSFPRYESHYARNKTDKNFLASNLTIKTMYDEYCKNCSSAQTNPVSRWLYEKEFHEMGLKIKPYKIDICNKCDTLAAEVVNAKTEEERVLKLQEQKIHHTSWQLARDLKAEDVKEAKVNEKVEVIVFDLQQCLPTPHLQTSVIFYKRQLWVYNLTLHICSNDRSIHNMWHEGEGERGPNQIGSALYHYIMSLPDEIEHVVLWSDTCGGQNKNSIVAAALQTILQHKKSLKIIDQKFLIPGHTHLECDRDHSVIEAKKKQATSIFVPRDWFNLVETANRKFSVNRLTKDNMLDFKALLKEKESPLVKRKKDTSKNIFAWKKTVWLRHSRDFAAGEVAFKHSFNEEESFQFLNIKRKKKGVLVLQPGLAYNGPWPINRKKKKDLLSLLYLIDPECHSFYHALVSSEQADIDPDLRGETDEEESGEE